jgi:hypothetical protein
MAWATCMAESSNPAWASPSAWAAAVDDGRTWLPVAANVPSIEEEHPVFWLVADARHSWLDALSSAGALAGPVAVAFGQPWDDPVAGLAITALICHVGWEVTTGVVHRLADGVDQGVVTAAESAAGSVPGVVHAHARARWTGRTLRVEVEGWVDPDMTARDADALGRQLPQAGSLTWTSRAAPG